MLWICLFNRIKRQGKRLSGSTFKRQSMSLIVKKRSNSVRWLFQSMKPWNITTAVRDIKRKLMWREPRENMDWMSKNIVSAVCLSVLSDWPWLSVCLFDWLTVISSVCLSDSFSSCLSIDWLTFCHCVCYHPVCLSVCLPACLSVCLSRYS